MDFKDKLRPLSIGASIGHISGVVGTLGAFVTTKDGIGILSADHVLAPIKGKAKKGDWIHHPALIDCGGGLTARTRIAKLYKFTTPSQNSPNLIGAGVALLNNYVTHLGNRIPKGIGCPVEGHVLAEIDENSYFFKNKVKVGKIGRTTGYTEGIIETFSVNGVQIQLDKNTSFTFNNLIVIVGEHNTPFSLPGDAGAMVFTLEPVQVIGLLYAGSGDGSRSLVCPITSILQALNVNLLGD